MKKYFDYKRLLGQENPILRYPELFDAAVMEFSKKKFEDASLNDILKNADMSKGSLYHHFGDKFGLFLCMIDVIVQKKLEFFSSKLQGMQNSGDFFGTFKQIFRATLEFMLVDKRFHYLYMRLLESGDKLKAQILEYYPYDYEQGLGPLIGSAVDSGQIDRRFSPEFIANVLEILLMNSEKLFPSDIALDQIPLVIDQIMDMMQYGISAKMEEKK